MPLNVIFFLIFFTVFLLIVALFFIIRRAQNPTVKRMKSLEKNTVHGDGSTKPHDFKRQKDRVTDNIEKLLADISRFIKQDEKKTSRAQAELLQAGYHKEEAVRIFTGIRLVSTLGFFVLSLLMGLKGNKPFNTILFLSILMGFVGWVLPGTILRFKIRKRQGDIAQSLPDALDLLVITVEAGLGLNAALLRVGADLYLRCPPLAEEFNYVTQDLRT